MAHHAHAQEKEFLTVRPRTMNTLLGLALIAVVAFVLGLIWAPTRAWVSFLVGLCYITSLGVGGLFFVAVQNVVRSSWATPFKRIPEAMAGILPVATVGAAILVAGAHSLYEWTHHDVVMNDPILAAKEPFLNIKFFVVRMVIYFVGWLVFAKTIIGKSLRQDQTGDIQLTNQAMVPSIGFLIFFGFSICLFSYDTLMSLEPHWFSTIFGPYYFAGTFVSTVSVIVIILHYLQKAGYLPNVNENHYHDLGKFMFGFSTFWAYIWFSQFLLIWYSNIPEETFYYLNRWEQGFKWVFLINILWNWFIPFMVLLPRECKRNSSILSKVAIWLLIGRWIDLYLMAAPGPFHHNNIHGPGIGALEVVMGVGFVALAIWLTLKRLSRHPIIAKNDPNYQEGLHLHQ